MGDWLGTGNVAPWLRPYRPFEKAREYVRSLRLRNYSEWRAFCTGKLPEKGSLPPDVPICPNSVYAKKGWSGVRDWLGTGTGATFRRQYRQFEAARMFARSLGLGGGAEWLRFCKGELPEKGSCPSDIPSQPFSTYAIHGWVGMRDWLGVEKPASFRIAGKDGKVRYLRGQKRKVVCRLNSNSSMHITAILHDCSAELETGFAATCVEFPEANGQGESVEACTENLCRAIRDVVFYRGAEATVSEG